eukprot:TRINITY_DN2694_c0_g2_i2.p1 TRINITY_DN2694_c0_g2~~TRINITY_DN2694_c0_g2_i2.p1  ORF type:complete len:261 (+),score=34.44 TRINITY_DN2694_c0_g2_i2:98-784(+)
MLQNRAANAKMGRIVFDLFVVVFIQRDFFPAYHLPKWFALNFPVDISQFDNNRPEIAPEYWEAIYRSALIGDMKTATDLLRLHSNSSSPNIKTAITHMETMPRVDQVQFEARWRSWHNESKKLEERARQRLAVGSASENHFEKRNLYTLCGILSGKQEDLLEVASSLGAASSWVLYLVSVVVYHAPLVGPDDLCVTRIGQNAQCRRPPPQIRSLRGLFQLYFLFELRI